MKYVHYGSVMFLAQAPGRLQPYTQI